MPAFPELRPVGSRRACDRRGLQVVTVMYTMSGTAGAAASNAQVGIGVMEYDALHPLGGYGIDIMLSVDAAELT